MNIELIIFLAIWLVSTEVIFFRFIRKDMEESFFAAKFASIAFGLITTMILFAFPITLSSDTGSTTNPNLMAYVWYYGIIFSIAAFFSINYVIHKWLKGNGK